jgi:hypothetical protein
MVEALIVRPLERGQIAQAFPLVRAVLPQTSLSRWTDFARRHIHERVERASRGIMAAQNRSGYIAGLFTHEARDELALGRTLAIGNLVVADFPGRDGTVAYLIEGMHALANLSGCVAVSVDLDIAFFDGMPTSGWSLPIFERSGFVAVSASRCRKLLEIRTRPSSGPPTGSQA